MGHISRYPFIAHYQGAPTDHIVHLSNGKIHHEGLGRSFWFRPTTSALAEVPAIDHEHSALFHAVTADRQDIAVQAVVTYRFADPAMVAQHFDFNIYPIERGQQPQGPRQVAKLVEQLAQSITTHVIAALPLSDALHSGITHVHNALVEQLSQQTRLSDTGINVYDVRVLSLRPTPEVEKALQTPLRERLQAEADRALYTRRAQAVEQEQRISENEAAAKLELARRHKEIIAQEAANERLQAEEKAAASLIAARGNAEATEVTENARAAAMRLIGQAEADNERERLAAYTTVSPEILHALALRELATHLPAIGQLNLTPDMLSSALGNFVATSKE